MSEERICQPCAKRTSHYTQFRIVTAPNGLFVQPGRVADSGTDSAFMYLARPERDFTLPGVGDRFDLVGVVYRYHRSRGAVADHHYVLKCSDGRWWRLADGCLPRVFCGDVEQSELRNVHLLVYTKPRARTWFADTGTLSPVRVGASKASSSILPGVAVAGRGGVPAAASLLRPAGATFLKRRRAVACRVGVRKAAKSLPVWRSRGRHGFEAGISRLLMGQRLWLPSGGSSKRSSLDGPAPVAAVLVSRPSCFCKQDGP